MLGNNGHLIVKE